MNVDSQKLYQHDLDQTLANRERLQNNRNLMFWYRELYRDLFRTVPDIAQKRVLEIGSGTSPLKMFLPNVITTDVLTLEHLDLVFDCHNIADLAEIPDHSIDVITLTNVLHHLRDPIHFLHGASRKLRKGGDIFIVEPYFSVLSYSLFKFLHHEPVNFDISRPVLDTVDGPLSSSNQAIPYMIFFSRPNWLKELADNYELEETRFGFFTSLAYMVTGGISRIFPVPHCIYRPYLMLDRSLARMLPKLFASFFSVRLVAKR
ncbi:bifunctional 2-polyprenyl-6-hydroxyphenol methylase/3-demethylubiquinol 3-O-methyltransferase UbiG [Burkholderia sp. L27(2015)]|uniref:class I SAM-dependent methyltransferase n=1 Tax=Burkholderia sp. L27(2015) TaxID=1641858 RepID=UPI00131BE78E|nr:methyltransferase domain-containing protein [Burkholderia sp. L27(2015)]